MRSRFWNQPIVDGRKMLLEQLEERIVLDASFDTALTGTDSLINGSDTCPSCTARISGSLPMGSSVAFQEVLIDEMGNSVTGRLDGYHEPVVHGTLHGSGPGHGRIVDITSNLPETKTVYMLFIDHGNGCKYGANGQYTAADFPGWTVDSGNCFLLSNTLPAKGGSPLNLVFDKTEGNANQENTLVDFAISVDTPPHTGCYVTTAEFTLSDYWVNFNKTWHDTYDISLVNGFNFPITLGTPYGDSVQALTETGNSNNRGVFGLGNDQCVASCVPPPSCCAEWGGQIAAEAHPCSNGAAPVCLASPVPVPCPENILPTGTQCSPNPVCQINQDQSWAVGYNNTFTVTVG
jgi:hypothetical protein